MQTMAEMIKAIRAKALEEGYQAGHRAGYQQALDEASQLAGLSTLTSDNVVGFGGAADDLESDGPVKPGTTQAFALAGVRANPGASAADIQRYGAIEGHDKPYQQYYTALQRLEKKGLVMNNDGKWTPLAGPQSSP